MPKPWDVCQEEPYAGQETRPSERSVKLSARPKGQSHLGPLSSDTELQDLEFALVGFDHVLIQYFLIVPFSSLLEWMLYILCHCMLEVYNLLFFLYGDYN